MSAPNEGRHGPPVAFRFIGQSGRKVDESSHAAIRSHAMTEFRNRQRQQRQQLQSASAKKLDHCQCRPIAASSSKATKKNSEKQSSDALTQSSCRRCGKIQSRTKASPKLVASRQAAPPAVVLSGAGLFDFSSISELIPCIPSKFIDEINAIKTHGPYSSPFKQHQLTCYRSGCLVSHNNEGGHTSHRIPYAWPVGEHTIHDIFAYLVCTGVGESRVGSDFESSCNVPHKQEDVSSKYCHLHECHRSGVLSVHRLMGMTLVLKCLGKVLTIGADFRRLCRGNGNPSTRN